MAKTQTFLDKSNQFHIFIIVFFSQMIDKKLGLPDDEDKPGSSSKEVVIGKKILVRNESRHHSPTMNIINNLYDAIHQFSSFVFRLTM